MLQDANYFHRLPRKRIAAGVLFVIDKGELFLVKPKYKDHWEIPGGVVEKNESPYQAALREVNEELGLDLKRVKFLSVDYSIPSGPKDESLQFVFFGGKLNKRKLSQVKLQSEELSGFKFAPIEEAKRLTSTNRFHISFPDRLEQSLKALREKKIVYLEDGKVVAK